MCSMSLFVMLVMEASRSFQEHITTLLRLHIKILSALSFRPPTVRAALVDVAAIVTAKHMAECIQNTFHGRE